MATPVSEIMDTTPPTVAPDASIEDVVRLLREHELEGVLVVDGDGRCLGIITDNDLVLPDEEGDLHIPHYLELFGGLVFLEPLGRFEERLRKAFAGKASDMMTADPVTISPNTSVQEAGRTMHETRHNRLPVVDEEGRLLGVVTRVDVLGALAA